MIRVQTVAVILLNPQRKVLLQQRDHKKNLDYAGWWTLPGGLVEEGETAPEAAERELLEELQVVIKPTLWKVYDRKHHELIDGHELVIEQHIFVATIAHKESDFEIGEGRQVAYFSQLEYQKLQIAYQFDELLEEFFESRKL